MCATERWALRSAQHVGATRRNCRSARPYSALVITRQPTSDERAFLDALLSRSFDGVEALRIQWADALVRSSCECGCGSLGFVFDGEVSPSAASSPLPVEGEILDDDGEVVGGIIVLLRDGVLDDVDVHSFTDGPLPFPTLASIRWSE